MGYKMKNENSLVLLIIIIFLFLLSCTDDQQSEEQKLNFLKIGIIPITDCSQLYAAKELKIFKKIGLEVQLVPIAGGARILETLAANEIDLGFSNLASAVFYEQNFGKLVQLAGGTMMDTSYSEAGMVCLKNSQIRNIEDLKGKTIAINSLNNIVHLAVVKALKKYDVSTDDVDFVEMKFSDMPIALLGKRIDIATLPEPLLTASMEEGNLRNLGDHFTIAFDKIYSTGYFTNPKKIGDNPKKFEKFNKAIIEITPRVNEFKDDIAAAASKYTKVPSNILKNAGRALFIKELPLNAMEQMRSWLIEEKFLE